MERPPSPHTNSLHQRSHERSSPTRDSQPDRGRSSSPQISREQDFKRPPRAGTPHPRRQSSPSSPPPQQSESPSEEFQPQPPTRTPTASEPKKCWICYSDSTEDDPENPPQWRSPCPCALVAHETCLLDWIADIENPKNKKPSNGKILCPQCKNEIKVERPKSLVLAALRYVDRLATKLIIPGIASVLVGTTWAGLRAHGLVSIYAVFGHEETKKIFENMGSRRGWLHAGLPLIPVALIAQRTRYSALVSPVSIIFLLAVQYIKWPGNNLPAWPASPASTFACLPIVHGAYNQFYDRIFGDLNKKWLAEVQPRAPEGENNEQEGNAEAAGGADEGEVVVDFNIEFGFGSGNDEPADNNDAPEVAPPAERQEQRTQEVEQVLNDVAQVDSQNIVRPPTRERMEDVARTRAPPHLPGQTSFIGHAPESITSPTNVSGATSRRASSQIPDSNSNRATSDGREARETQRPAQTPPTQNHDQDQNQNPDTAADPNNPNQPQNLLGRRGDEFIVDSTSIAQTVLGALIFPAVSSTMGQFLFYTLPTTLTSQGSKVRLLETRWGRSVVGGALFVVLRDVVVTYSRWRLAKGHRMRRVVDYKKVEGSD